MVRWGTVAMLKESAIKYISSSVSSVSTPPVSFITVPQS
jgi:hypothetical protein